jgi:hypothetical protein
MRCDMENKNSKDDTVNNSELYLWAWDCGLDWDNPETLPPREQLTEDILHAPCMTARRPSQKYPAIC